MFFYFWNSVYLCYENETSKEILIPVTSELKSCIITDTEFDSSYLDEVVCVRGHRYVWGLREVVSAVSPSRLQKYSWLVTNLSTFPGYTVSLHKIFVILYFQI